MAPQVKSLDFKLDDLIWYLSSISGKVRTDSCKLSSDLRVPPLINEWIDE